MMAQVYGADADADAPEQDTPHAVDENVADATKKHEEFRAVLSLGNDHVTAFVSPRAHGHHGVMLILGTQILEQEMPGELSHNSVLVLQTLWIHFSIFRF